MTQYISDVKTLRVTEAIHTGRTTIVELIGAGFTKSQAYNGVRVLQDHGFAAKRQLYQGIPAKYVLVVPIEEVRAALDRRCREHASRRPNADALLGAWALPVRLPQGSARMVVRD